jgi:glycosyltransferase 2 family protein
MKNKKWIFRLIGIAILIYILFRVDLSVYISFLRNLHLSAFICACGIVLSIYFIKSFRWKILLGGQGINYSYKNSFLAFTGSNFIAFITPGRVGEFTKIFYLKNDQNVPYARSFPSVLIDRLFDVYVLLLTGLYGLIELKVIDPLYIYLTSAIFLLLPFLLFNNRILSFLMRFVVRMPGIARIARKKDESIQSLINEFRTLFNFRLVFAFLITVVSYLILYYATWIIAGSIDLHLKYSDVILIVSVANVLSFLPISVSGFGTREAVFVYFLGRIGYPAELALMYSTLFFLCFNVIGGLYGYVCFMIKPLNLRLFRKEIK